MGLPLNFDRDVDRLRERLGRGLFTMVAGPEGPRNRTRIHEAPGPRWFAEDRPIRRVHGDAAMFVGGLRALLLQSLHPLAMAGVAQHSDYRGDPWGRLQRTSTFLAVTTFGTATDAQRAVDKVRGIHRRVHGQAPDGRAYRADDPHLLQWVHIAEVDSFLRAYQLYGATPLDQDGRDAYVADTARVAAALGVLDPPRTEVIDAARAYAAAVAAVPKRIAEHRSRQGGGPLPSCHSPAAADGSGALRGHRCDVGVDAARVGTATAATAVSAAGGSHCDSTLGARSSEWNPLGTGSRSTGIACSTVSSAVDTSWPEIRRRREDPG